jgi:4-hydroxyphenylacetate 3-monooxygenase
MGLVQHEATIEQVVDLAITVQTVRSCLFATERDPRFTAAGYCVPNPSHLAAGGIAMLQARQRMAEILRMVPGSSLVVAPSDRDLAAPEVAAGLADAFGGGGYTALQRAALLQLAWDHVASALDGRESAFELHASGGLPAWRGRLRRSFERYNEIANAVRRSLDVGLPDIDLSSLREVPWAPRRPVTPPAPPPAGPEHRQG